jgi:tRNA(Ile)-lysidine synthase
MQVDLEPGKYVVAVSGGVDSMVLLDMLRAQPGVELVVAHFDHGIRPDSAADRKFVQEVASSRDLPFMYEEGELGADASEAVARAARYGFLRRVRKEQGARTIVIAHHQDDVLETAVLNLLRGTGRKGLASLGSNGEIVRPLLDTPKQALLEYARKHQLEWREDPTNTDERYLRNYVRQKIIPRFSAQARQELLGRIGAMRELNREIDEMLEAVLRAQPGADRLHRRWFIALPHNVSREVLAAWLRQNGVPGFTRQQIERLVAAAKTKPPGKLADIDAAHVLSIEKQTLRFAPR